MKALLRKIVINVKYYYYLITKEIIILNQEIVMKDINLITEGKEKVMVINLKISGKKYRHESLNDKYTKFVIKLFSLNRINPRKKS